MSEIKPAMTAEEWAGWFERGLGTAYTVGVLDYRDPTITPHMHAALILYKKPFGFTREDVDALRVSDDGYDDDALLQSIADRIEALLPPLVDLTKTQSMEIPSDFFPVRDKVRFVDESE